MLLLKLDKYYYTLYGLQTLSIKYLVHYLPCAVVLKTQITPHLFLKDHSILFFFFFYKFA